MLGAGRRLASGDSVRIQAPTLCHELLGLSWALTAVVELIQRPTWSWELHFGVLWSAGLCSSSAEKRAAAAISPFPSLSLHIPSHFSRTIFLLNHQPQV